MMQVYILCKPSCEVVFFVLIREESIGKTFLTGAGGFGNLTPVALPTSNTGNNYYPVPFLDPYLVLVLYLVLYLVLLASSSPPYH